MTTYNPAWDSSWTATSIASSTVANSGNATTAAIDDNNKTGTEVSVTCVYGGTAVAGLQVYVLRDVDGTNYESINDNPWGFQMAYGVSGTYHRTFTVSGNLVSKFKVYVTNPSGASVTVTVNYKYATINSA